MKITKGVIAAAGMGTRFLPATRAVPKEMLPVVDKPIIQCIVEEFAAAGIRDIVIVTASGGSAIESHFRANPRLAAHLRQSGKRQMARQMRALSQMARLTFITQKGPYGNGTPCLNAARHIGSRPFAYAFGDDLVLSKISFTKQMIEACKKQPGMYLGAQEVEAKDIHKYGIMEIKGSKGGKGRRGGQAGSGEISGIVEKPDAARAPSNLANIGRFILPPQIFSVLAKKRLGKGGELWLVDAISELISQGQKAYYKRVENGQWHTTGDPVAYLEAVRAFAVSRPDYRSRVKHIFR